MFVKLKVAHAKGLHIINITIYVYTDYAIKHH